MTVPGRSLLALVLLAAAGLPADAFGRSEPQVIPVNEAVGLTVRVRGVVNRYGNVPHTFLGLLVEPDELLEIVADGRRAQVPDGTVFELAGDATPELDRYQGRLVEVEGVLAGWREPPGPLPVILVERYERAAE